MEAHVSGRYDARPRQDQGRTWRPRRSNDPDLKDAFDDFLGAFGAFREANDERLAELERKLSADVVTEEKVARINPTRSTARSACSTAWC